MDQLSQILETVARIEQRLNVALAQLRSEPATPKPLTTGQFAAAVGRSVFFIREEIKLGRIRTIRGTRIFLIPHTELSRYLTVRAG
jgi:hypothetical protein